MIWATPLLNSLDANRVGSSNVGLPWRLRPTSQYTRPPIAAAPIARSSATDSPPACHDEDTDDEAAHADH